MKKVALIESGILLVAGAVAMGDAIRLVAFRSGGPVEDITGPGRYLFLIGLLLSITAVAYAWSRYRSTSAPDEHDAEDPAARWKVRSIVLGLVAYIFLIQHLGYVVSTILFSIALLKILGGDSWLSTVVTGAVMTAALYLVFVVMAGMIFPRGALLF